MDLKPDDVNIALGGEVVTNLHRFDPLLAERMAGETVDVTTWRDGQTLTFLPVLVEDR